MVRWKSQKGSPAGHALIRAQKRALSQAWSGDSGEEGSASDAAAEQSEDGDLQFGNVLMAEAEELRLQPRRLSPPQLQDPGSTNGFAAHSIPQHCVHLTTDGPSQPAVVNLPQSAAGASEAAVLKGPAKDNVLGQSCDRIAASPKQPTQTVPAPLPVAAPSAAPAMAASSSAVALGRRIGDQQDEIIQALETLMCTSVKAVEGLPGPSVSEVLRILTARFPIQNHGMKKYRKLVDAVVALGQVQVQVVDSQRILVPGHNAPQPDAAKAMLATASTNVAAEDALIAALVVVLQGRRGAEFDAVVEHFKEPGSTVASFTNSNMRSPRQLLQNLLQFNRIIVHDSMLLGADQERYCCLLPPSQEEVNAASAKLHEIARQLVQVQGLNPKRQKALSGLAVSTAPPGTAATPPSSPHATAATVAPPVQHQLQANQPQHAQNPTSPQQEHGTTSMPAAVAAAVLTQQDRHRQQVPLALHIQQAMQQQAGPRHPQPAGTDTPPTLALSPSRAVSAVADSQAGFTQGLEVQPQHSSLPMQNLPTPVHDPTKLILKHWQQKQQQQLPAAHPPAQLSGTRRDAAGRLPQRITAMSAQLQQLQGLLQGRGAPQGHRAAAAQKVSASVVQQMQELVVGLGGDASLPGMQSAVASMGQQLQDMQRLMAQPSTLLTVGQPEIVSAAGVASANAALPGFNSGAADGSANAAAIGTASGAAQALPMLARATATISAATQPSSSGPQRDQPIEGRAQPSSLQVAVASGMQRGGHSAAAASELSKLHHEVLDLARRAAPTPAEVAAVERALSAVSTAARNLWPDSNAVLFGSQATGLALPGSDLDVVILGVAPALARAGSGFSRAQRGDLAELLEDLLDALRAAGLIAGRAKIIEAKVPIIKARIAPMGGAPVPVDISIGTANGAHAVAYITRQIQAMPALRPLALVVKAFLKERRLNEVFTGGLSSYSIVNMVIAHLQAEGQRPAPLPKPSSQALLQLPVAQQVSFLQHLPEMNGGGGGGGVRDLGVLLWGFFNRFGRCFRYESQAVSVGLGGVVAKPRAWKVRGKPWLLAVEDPQEPGKDIGQGSYNIGGVKAAFAAAADALAAAAEEAASTSGMASELRQWAAVQAEGQDYAAGNSEAKAQVLGHIISIDIAVDRGARAAAARKALEATGGGGKAKGMRKTSSKRRITDRLHSNAARQLSKSRGGKRRLESGAECPPFAHKRARMWHDAGASAGGRGRGRGGGGRGGGRSAPQKQQSLRRTPGGGVQKRKGGRCWVTEV